MHSSYQGAGTWAPSISLRVEYVCNLLGIFLHRRFDTSLPFIYVSSLYQYGSMDIYILEYNPILFYLSFCSRCSSFGLWERFFWVPCPFQVCLFEAFPEFLTLWDTAGLSCIFSAPVLESAISPKSTNSFCWKLYLNPRSGHQDAQWYWFTFLWKSLPCLG